MFDFTEISVANAIAFPSFAMGRLSCWPLDIHGRDDQISLTLPPHLDALLDGDEFRDDVASRLSTIKDVPLPSRGPTIEPFNVRIVDDFLVPKILNHLGAKGALKFCFNVDVSKRTLYVPVFNDASNPFRSDLVPEDLMPDEMFENFKHGNAPHSKYERGSLRTVLYELAGFGPFPALAASFHTYNLPPIRKDTPQSQIDTLERVIERAEALVQSDPDTFKIINPNTKSSYRSSFKVLALRDWSEDVNLARQGALREIYPEGPISMPITDVSYISGPKPAL